MRLHVTDATGEREGRPRGGHGQRPEGELTVRRIGDFAGLAALREPWRALHQRVDSRNPYAAPEWSEVWARHFSSERELNVLAVERGPELVGVAPCYLRRLGPVLRTVHLLGAGRHDELTELPAVLCAAEDARTVLRAVVRHWCERSAEWDWLDLPLGAEQGWLEPEWLSGPVALRGLIRHRTTRPSVVLPLPASVEALRPGLKRNVKESVRRARNRLNRSGREWTVTTHRSPSQVARALPWLAELHAARAQLAGRRRHGDVLADPRHRDFLAEVLPLLAEQGRAEILTLDVEERPVAALLVLHAPGAGYLGVSGVDPAWWSVSPVTLLQLTAAENAVRYGRGEFNLSLGPDVAKLRWSERIVQHPEFTVCGPSTRSRAGYTAYAAAAAVAGVRREAARHRIHGGSTSSAGADGKGANGKGANGKGTDSKGKEGIHGGQ